MEWNISQDRATQLARAVLTRNLKIRPGENVIIEGWSHALPWAVALSREARRLKAHPIILYEDEDTFWDLVDHKQESTYGAAPSHEWAALGKTGVYIHMWGPGDKVRIGSLPEIRQEKIHAWNDKWYETATKAGLRGARLEVGRPYPTLAEVYGVDQKSWTDQLVEASQVEPEKLRASGIPIVKAFETGRRVRIRDDEGTDLTLGLLHRKALLNSGLITHQEMKRPFGMLTSLPTGVVSVAIDENVAEGQIVANRSSYTDDGKATGGILKFRDGRLVEQHYETDGEQFDKMFRKCGKGRDQPGQLRVGLNPKLHDTPQLEDIEAGAVTVCVGRNVHLPGGKNKSGYFGFVVNVGARVEVDGKLLPLPG